MCERLEGISLNLLFCLAKPLLYLTLFEMVVH